MMLNYDIIFILTCVASIAPVQFPVERHDDDDSDTDKELAYGSEASHELSCDFGGAEMPQSILQSNMSFPVVITRESCCRFPSERGSRMRKSCFVEINIQENEFYHCGSVDQVHVDVDDKGNGTIKCWCKFIKASILDRRTCILLAYKRLQQL